MTTNAAEAEGNECFLAAKPKFGSKTHLSISDDHDDPRLDHLARRLGFRRFIDQRFQNLLTKDRPEIGAPCPRNSTKQVIDLIDIGQVIKVALLIIDLVQKPQRDPIFLNFRRPMRDALECFVQCLCTVPPFHRGAVICHLLRIISHNRAE